MSEWIRKINWKYVVVMLIGNIILGLGIAIFKLSGLGNDPFSGMVMALAECVGIEYARFLILLVLSQAFQVSPVVLRNRGSIGCFCNFCRGNFCVYCDFSVLSAGILWLWVSCRMCTVLFYSYDPSGTLYQTSAILYSQHTAGGSRRQIGGIYQNRMFYG